MTTTMHNDTTIAVTEISRPQPAFEDCAFYHTVDLPTGTVRGSWDLRPTVDAYLGHGDFRGKSVLEIGPASGFLSFHMEQAGAEVTALEPSMARLWDAVPLAGFAMEIWRDNFAKTIGGVRNSFWYLHHLYQSKVRLIEADPEAIPAAAGNFDIGVLAAVLLHTRSPISILESVARRVRDTIIVTDLYDAHLGELPICRFLPRADLQQVDTWWAFTPAFFVSALQVLGFPQAEVTTHHQKRETDGLMIPMFTVVARRTPSATA